MKDFMIGSYKFQANSTEEAVKIAKRKMLEKGWRNLRLMSKGRDGWGVCQIIPQYENQ